MNQITKAQIEKLKSEGKPLGCMGCLGQVDDGEHEYNQYYDSFWCPVLDEEEDEEGA